MKNYRRSIQSKLCLVQMCIRDSSERPRMRLFRVRAQEVIGKAQYPIAAVDEVPIPVFED